MLGVLSKDSRNETRIPREIGICVGHGRMFRSSSFHQPSKGIKKAEIRNAPCEESRGNNEWVYLKNCHITCTFIWPCLLLRLTTDFIAVPISHISISPIEVYLKENERFAKYSNKV